MGSFHETKLTAPFVVIEVREMRHPEAPERAVLDTSIAI
jgi:hypothetical protein